MPTSEKSRSRSKQEARETDARRLRLDDAALPSILFPPAMGQAELVATEPACFGDLNLDQLVFALLKGREVHELDAFFYTPLRSAEAVARRHEVFRDLEQGSTLADLRGFAAQMQTVRNHLGLVEKFGHPLQRRIWLLAAINLYLDAVAMLAARLTKASLTSGALEAVRAYVQAYASSGEFLSRRASGLELAASLSTIRYDVLFQGLRVQIGSFESKADLSSDVAQTFEPFRQGDVRRYPFEFDDSIYTDRIEGEILRCVGERYAELFDRITAFSDEDVEFRDRGVLKFDRELQFYFAYLDHIEPLEAAGLAFCLPKISADATVATRSFDLSLASKLVQQQRQPILNDVRLDGAERVIVVSGPNQGGKTTFARMFGQLHYLAALGLPVPAASAELGLFDHLLTHFERQERVTDLTGKLQNDLVRIRDILGRATGESIIVINEIFASTALRDATDLSIAVVKRIIQLDARCVWVTFVEDIATEGPTVVSMVSTVTPENPAIRTFRVVRRPPDGLAYALSIAEKHRLTYNQILARARA